MTASTPSLMAKVNRFTGSKKSFGGVGSATSSKGNGAMIGLVFFAGTAKAKLGAMIATITSAAMLRFIGTLPAFPPPC